MGIFRHDLSEPPDAEETAREEMPRTSAGLGVRCDRCQVAEAQVEVVTDVGSVFLCQHHHNEHRDSIVAAGHWIRVGPGYWSA